MEKMSLLGWFISFILNNIFWAWIIWGGGAKFLEGKFTSGMFLSIFAIKWSEKGIKLFSWLQLIISNLWFILGLFYPETRFLL